jgi:hypothetical protein
MKTVFRGVALVVAGAFGCFAATINVGLISYDAVFGGVTGFTIENLTNAPTCGGACTPSDFPVSSDVAFTDLTLTVFTGSGSETRALTTAVSPGSVSPGEFLFANSEVFTSAELTGRVDLTLLGLETGAQVSVLPTFTAIIVPSAGAELQVGDFALIQLDTSGSTAVPEPATAMLTLSGCALLVCRCVHLSHRRRVHSLTA